MTIEIDENDQQRLNRIVAHGNFASVKEALHSCLAATEALFDAPDADWNQYVEHSMERGLQSAAEGPLAPTKEIIAELRARRIPAI